MDLSRVARHLTKVAEGRGDFKLVPLSESDIAIVVILCGCPRTCGNKEEVRARGRQSLVIGGESVGGKPVPEKHLPTTVEQELVRTLEHLTVD